MERGKERDRAVYMYVTIVVKSNSITWLLGRLNIVYMQVIGSQHH